MRLLLRVLALAFWGLIAYLASWPVAVHPVVWEAPEAEGFVGAFASNGKLGKFELRGSQLIGPEALAADARGRIFTGTLNGDLVRLGPSGKTQVITNTGGRPLGLKVLEDGSLIVADAAKGLLRLTPESKLEPLVQEYAGKRLVFTNDVEVLPDGRVLFTDSSTHFGLPEFELDALEHRPSGRLFVYDPQSKRTSLLRDALIFPNGVAASGDGSFALVNEMWAYRVTKVFLTGDRRGQTEVLIENLPGFPDNISYDKKRDLFWVALASPRDAGLDLLAPFPALRRMVARLPKTLRPKAQRHAMVLALRGDGTVAGFFDDPRATSYSPVTSVLALGDMLYLGSFQHNGVARLPMPALTPAPRP
jgi:sugar lactone lactonase YvrE